MTVEQDYLREIAAIEATAAAHPDLAEAVGFEAANGSPDGTFGAADDFFARVGQGVAVIIDAERIIGESGEQ